MTLPVDDPPLKEFDAVVLVESVNSWPIGTVGAICDMLSETYCHFEIFYRDGWTAGLEIVPITALRCYDSTTDGPVSRCTDDLLEAHPEAENRREGA